MSKMRKRLFILGAVFFSTSQFSSAQITFQRTFGGIISNDGGYSVQQTTDEGYIITGATSLGAGNLDVYLIKTNTNGDTLWTKSFGSTGQDEGRYIQQTIDGGYIIAALTDSFGAGHFDFYLIKTDSIGDTLWTRTLGGTNSDKGYSVQQTSDGGYIIAGLTFSFGVGNNDLYLIRTNTNGDTLWTKTFGGTGYDGARSVHQTSDGGFIITGGIDSVGVGSDVCLIKTDSNGDPGWIKVFGDIGDEIGYDVKQTTDGGYIISGSTNSFGAGTTDTYLIKTDSNGNLIWSKTFGDASTDVGYSVQQTTDGGYIIAGYTYSFGAGYSDVYLIKTDSTGDTLWTKTFGGAFVDGAYSVRQTFDGGYIITGYYHSLGSIHPAIYLIKTDSIGNSGCNEGGTATIVNSPATQVSSPATIITSSPPTILNTQATIVGSGSIVTTLCTTVGINEITTNNSFLISPNPSAGNLIISFQGSIVKGDIEILNILGANVFTTNIFNESKKEINLKNISSGIYFVKVHDGEKYYCMKVILEQD
jgi:hypothetical protein